jgi:type II secretory pathway component PulK
MPKASKIQQRNTAKRVTPKRLNRRGMALLVVVVLVMLISLAAYRYSFEMENEYRVTRLQEEQVQARLAALSGVEFAAAFLEQPLAIRNTLLNGTNPEKIFSRSIEEEATRLNSQTDDESSWQFAILGRKQSFGSNDTASVSGDGPNDLSQGSIKNWKWGFESEGGKLHIPTLLKWNQLRPGIARTILLQLPDADEESVDAWLAQFGVRTVAAVAQDILAQASSSGLQSPTQRKQRTEAADRLRLRWFGGDLDQNYQIDPWEDALLGKLLVDPTGSLNANPMLRDLSKLNSTPANNSNATGENLTDATSEQSGNAWKGYLSWVQGERNEKPDGKPKIALNQPDLRKLHQELSQALSVGQANFIVAMRQYGPGIGNRTRTGSNAPNSNRSALAPNSRLPIDGSGRPRSQSGQSPSTRASSSKASVTAEQWTPNWQDPPRYQLTSVLEVIDVNLDASPIGGAARSASTSQSANSPSSSAGGSGTQGNAASQGNSITSPWASGTPEFRSSIRKLLDETTLQPQPIIEGRIDFTTAPAIVLAAVPGIDPALAQKIIQTRQEAALRGPEESIESIAWLMEKGLVDARKLVELEPFLTTRSDVFSLQSVGFRDEKSPVFRCTVVIDARQIPAQVRDVQVWHPWDRGFSAESLQPGVQ